MPDHTKGPWSIDHDGRSEPYQDIEIKAGRRTVVRLMLDDAPVHDFNAEQWANAHLIANAPDLLGLVREWVDLRDGGHSPQLLQDHADKCRAVLARAEGVAS